jgi:hypothetical protein
MGGLVAGAFCSRFVIAASKRQVAANSVEKLGWAPAGRGVV